MIESLEYITAEMDEKLDTKLESVPDNELTCPENEEVESFCKKYYKGEFSIFSFYIDNLQFFFCLCIWFGAILLSIKHR